jgi:hypothetical protein
MHDPLVCGNLLDSRPPLAQTRLFPDVDLLAAANQAHHDTPLRNAFGELDEVLGL